MEIKKKPIEPTRGAKRFSGNLPDEFQKKYDWLRLPKIEKPRDIKEWIADLYERALQGEAELPSKSLGDLGKVHNMKPYLDEGSISKTQFQEMTHVDTFLTKDWFFIDFSELDKDFQRRKDEYKEEKKEYDKWYKENEKDILLELEKKKNKKLEEKLAQMKEGLEYIMKSINK